MRKLRRRSRRRQFNLKKLANGKLSTYALRGAVVSVIAFFLLGFGIFAYFSRDLPEPGEIQRNSGFSTVFYDRDGEVLFEMFEDKNRIPVSIDDVPETLKQATIAVEDKNFYEHQGFSLWGYIRSVFRIVTTGRLAGGSTLTQQLVKNVLLTQERTVTRKIKELVLAVEIERRFTKDEILEMYFNESPYGGTFWGVQSASKGYFDKDVKDLNLIESAIIAGLPQRPSVYSPISGTPDAYKGRTKDVLRRMREDGYITKDEEKKALEDLENVKFEKSNIAIQAPHFVFYVRDLIAEQFGEKILDEGIKIKTTLSLDAQEAAQDIVEEEIEDIRSLNATNGAVVVLDTESSEVLAMVGSYDYDDDEFGRFNATQGLRQPGSSVKPFNYATAFKQGYTPSSLIMDVETEFPNQGGESYSPVNYDGEYRGPVQYRFALANSMNVPAVKILAQVGIKNFLQTAYDMGIEEFEPTTDNVKRFGLSATLGGGETTLVNLTNAYATFGRGGEKLDTTAILEIRDHNDKVIFENKKQKPTRVLDEGIAFLISHILSDNNARSIAFGTNSLLNIPGKTVAVKTGTTNDKRDNWAVGFTNDVTVGVWVGNNDNTPMNSQIASGLTGASPIWNRVMRHLLVTYDDGIIDIPDNVIALQVDPLLGGLPKDSNTRSEYFIEGTEPTEVSDMYKRVKLSRSDDKKLANDIEIKAGSYEERDYIVLTENDPISTDGVNRWQEAINKWIDEQGDERYKVPRETSDAKQNDIIVQVKEPGNETRVNSNNVRIRARITSISDVKKIEIFANDVNIGTFTGNKKEIDESVNLSDGIYTIRVRAENEKGQSGDSKVKIGVNKDWDDEPEPSPEEEPADEASE